jgi:hypothetical protein
MDLLGKCRIDLGMKLKPVRAGRPTECLIGAGIAARESHGTGLGAAVSARRPRPQITTVMSTATETVTRTATVATRPPRRQGQSDRRRRMGRK